MSILDEVEQSLRDLAFKQILQTIGHDPSVAFTSNTTLSNGAFYSAFCLCCCFIETCGHYLTGRSGNGTSTASFKAFALYLQRIDARYDPDILYVALRCGLLHNFTPSSSGSGPRDFYELVHNKPELHLTVRSHPDASPSTSTFTTPASGTTTAPGSNAIFGPGKYLNLQNFVFDLGVAMDAFFVDAHSQSTIEQNVIKCARDNGFAQVR